MALFGSGYFYIKIGLGLGENPLQEFIFKPKATVTIGKLKKSRLVIPSWRHKEKFPFLKYTRKGYCLCLTEEISGRLSVQGKPITLDQLYEHNLIKKEKDSYQIFISEKVRGKFVFDGVRILLTFVPKYLIQNQKGKEKKSSTTAT